MLAAAMFAPATVSAVSFNPTRFDDPAPDGCAVNGCSLREAILNANGTSGATITLQAGTYQLTIRGADTPAPKAQIGDLDLLKPMTITGAGSGATFVQAGAAKGAGIHRIFDVFAPSPGVTISNMTIRNGNDVEARTGGCVKNTGNLRLSSVVVTG